MRVLILSRYGDLGASSRLRFYQYVPFLRQEGWSVDISTGLSNQYVRDLYAGRQTRLGTVAKAYLERARVLLGSRAYDLVWIEGELFPWLPALGERLLHSTMVPYVVDYDDAVFHRYDLHVSRGVRVALGAKIDHVMRNAALVVAGNEYLAHRARGAGSRRVEIVPTVVDLDRYPVEPHRRDTPGAVRIGWIGTPSTVDYLATIKDALDVVLERRRTQLALIGVDSGGPPGLPVEYIRWDEDTEVEALNSIDVGIMPLSDTPWERGKCGYKLIQYMACGLPVVASPVGVNRAIVENGRSGFLASTTEEWEESLGALIDDPQLRRQMGNAGRARVEDKYNLQATAPRLANLLRTAAGR